VVDDLKNNLNLRLLKRDLAICTEINEFDIMELVTVGSLLSVNDRASWDQELKAK
jgi:hypothetical protein